jgi:MFS family permease
MLHCIFIVGVFIVGSAVSKNAESIFITRFLEGLFASAPVSNISAALGDFYEATERGVPMEGLALHH